MLDPQQNQSACAIVWLVGNGTDQGQMWKTKIRPQIKPILLASLGSLVALLLFGDRRSLPWRAGQSHSKNTTTRPPPLLLRIGVSPGMISQYGPFTSYQVNVDANGQNITGDAANEPSICVDPTNANKMAIGWRQFNSVSSNFRQAGYGYTTDGGMTWTFPGVLENNVFRSDPVLNADDTGHFFYLSLLENIFCTTCGARSTAANPGRTSGRRREATSSGSPSITPTARVTDSNTSFGAPPAINYGGRQFSRSTDGGFTWMNPINIPNSAHLGNARRGLERQSLYWRRTTPGPVFVHSLDQCKERGRHANF